ncbi:karyopherin beta [Encephalitozoon intestinalis ATCC 50506]|uniref:Karyopherin beta n=1 Tax=Encephalitozoon intestinalis (strain ATCC 50506) TaxID=876142 RepID=E0S9Q9_ENCIT|nr:karyopherin beta [Encephalitozoon intestinalis ATCC 50506]ADM12444.1 karyopherin beta [Encephalitozoon intestinalis ATCC 50506]UTX46280.1 importin-beta [Encephalitozoon intestinalis]
MDRRGLESCLYEVLKSDSTSGKRAEAKILELQSSDFERFISILVEVFCDLKSNDQLRMVSGIILKNSLHANDPDLQKGCLSRWLGMRPESREYIKNTIKRALRGPTPRFCTMAGAALGQISRMEIPNSLYQGFFEEMKRMVCDEETACGVCEAVGTCCSYLTKEAPDILRMHNATVFEICIHPLKRGTTRESKLSGLKCLMNCMEVEGIFCYEENVNIFLNSTIEIWNGDDEELIHKLMICFNRLVMLNYKFIRKSILENILGQYLGRFFKSKHDEIKIQAIEYWCIFAEKRDEEMANKYMSVVLPEILSLLKKGPDYYEEIWSPHKAASSCLEIYTELKGDKMMRNGMIWGFIETSLKSESKADVDIGAVALGSVMHEKCEDCLVKIVPDLVAGIGFEESKDSCLWALSRTAECNFYALVDHLPIILSRCGSVVLESSKSSIGAAWAMDCIFRSVADSKRKEGFASHIPSSTKKRADDFVESFLVKQYLDILNVLVKGTELANLNDSSLRVALFSALDELILICPQTVLDILIGFYDYTSKKIDECISVLGYATQDQLLVVEDVLSNYIGLIEAIATARKREDVEDLLELFIRILESTPTIAFGEVYTSISNLSTKFAPHTSRILPYMTRDMRCTDRFVLNSVINLVGRLANTMGTDFNILATVLTSSLVQCLSSEATHRDLKPIILSVFGDIALALERNFESYLDMVVMLFQQISELNRHGDEEYVDDLRKNAVQLVNCSLVAIGDSSKVRNLLPRIISIAHKMGIEDGSGKTHEDILGLIDDLVGMYGKNFGLDEPWIKEFLYGMMKSSNDRNRKKASHVLEVLR